MQGIHGPEYLVLTLSVALGASRAVGLSTWFGALPNGPGLWTYRIWWHTFANPVGSVIFGMAVYHLWRNVRRSGPGTSRRTPRPSSQPGSRSGFR